MTMSQLITREYRVLDRLTPKLREAVNNAAVGMSALAIQDALLNGKSEAEIVERIGELREPRDVETFYIWAQGG